MFDGVICQKWWGDFKIYLLCYIWRMTHKEGEINQIELNSSPARIFIPPSPCNGYTERV